MWFVCVVTLLLYLQVAKLEQEAQRQKQVPASHSSLDRRAIRGGGGSHQAQEVRSSFYLVFFFVARVGLEEVAF